MSESAVGELDGRRVLVTGAATGIGAAAVEAFTSHGATVAATYHHTPAPQHLQDAARWRQCDVRSRTQVQHTIDAVHGGPGQSPRPGPIAGSPSMQWRLQWKPPAHNGLREFLGPDGTALLDQQLQRRSLG